MIRKKKRATRSHRRGSQRSLTHHQLAGEDLFVVADKVLEGLEEPDHALVLLQCGVLLERLLDQLPQLLGLGHQHVHTRFTPRWIRGWLTFYPLQGRKRRLYLHAVNQLLREEKVQTHFFPGFKEEKQV